MTVFKTHSHRSGKDCWACRRRRCAAYRLDQAPEVPLQCLRLPQLGVVKPPSESQQLQQLQRFSSSSGLRVSAQKHQEHEHQGNSECATLPSASVAWTCRTIESPMITASCSSLAERSEAVTGGRSRRTGGEKSSTGAWIASSTAAPRVLGEGHLGRSRPGCTEPVQRNTRCGGGGSVSSVLHTYPGLVSVSPGCSFSFPQLGLLPKQLVDVTNDWSEARVDPLAALFIQRGGQTGKYQAVGLRAT